jgi:hypothetical protein
MADPAQQVRDLIRLAIDAAASPNEARNAALQACRLIGINRLPVGHGGVQVSAPDWAQALARERGARIAAELEIKALRDQLARLNTPPPDQWVRMPAAKFAGSCTVCAKRIAVGTPCQWRKGRGVRCDTH